MKLYGIKTCDTCRKAIKALEAAGYSVQFVDIRVDGLEANDLDRWIAAVGWQGLLNTRSTTWRGLDEADKADLDECRARALMLAHPTLIKRPVIATGDRILVGFAKVQQAELLS